MLYDFGVTSDYTNLFNIPSAFVRTADRTNIFIDQTNQSSAWQTTLINPILIDEGVNVEFDLLYASYLNMQIGRYETGKSNSYDSYILTNIQSKTRVLIEIFEDKNKWYVNKDLVLFDSDRPLTQFNLFFRAPRNTILDFSYRNFKICKR